MQCNSKTTDYKIQSVKMMSLTCIKRGEIGTTLENHNDGKDVKRDDADLYL